MPGRDTRTGSKGVFARHREGCAVEKLPVKPTPTQVSKVCRCKPTFYGVAWDSDKRRPRKTKRFPTKTAATSAKGDLEKSLRDGTVPDATPAPRFRETRERFVTSAREGVALNKWGRRYKPKAVKALQSALDQVPDRIADRRLSDVQRGHIQGLVDDLAAKGLSGSRIRTIVHSIRSLYHWAQDRDMVNHDPAALVRLPAMDATQRDRVATPGEMVTLLDALELEDAVPYGIAAYTSARHQEIQTLDWRKVDVESWLYVELAADEAGRKSGSSWRVVPLVKPARILLRKEWIRQGRPTSGKVCPPRNENSRSGLLALSHLQTRVHGLWKDAGLTPIGLHECRHSTATWLDHAGVSPKINSMWVGHKTPDYQAGAAPITLGTYTHALPGELERARDLLDAFIAERVKEETG